MHRALQKLKWRPAFPAFRTENFEHLTFVINGPPQIVRLAIDL